MRDEGYGDEGNRDATMRVDMGSKSEMIWKVRKLSPLQVWYMSLISSQYLISIMKSLLSVDWTPEP